jgi:SAM-dependent methyltransferase
MTPAEQWLASLWPVVRGWLPVIPGAVVEIGCGPLGGFVPMLRSGGYDAVGVDPRAPDGPWYHQVEFEEFQSPEPALAVVACTSLHHTTDVGAVLDLARSALAPGASIVVVEWAREQWDEATARWCFDRLPPPATEPGWLQEIHDQWRESGQQWDTYCADWARSEGLHAGQDIVRELDARFDRQQLARGPYFFAELADVSEGDEQAAIDAGLIQPNRIVYVGRRS